MVSDMRKIQLVVFDIGGTVFSKGKQAFIDLLMKRLCRGRDEISAVIDGPDALEYRRNKISAVEYWRIVRDRLGVSDAFGDLEQLWFEQYIPIAGMPELIVQVRKRCRVAYLSNNTPERVAYLDRKYGFLNWFDGGIFSYEAGVVKADGGLYGNLLARFPDILPQEILIIDDREENMPMVRAAGFDGFVFKDAVRLAVFLQERGILTF